ncbi:hypothetical protein [Escherichia coli]|uniref:hypothetical protein n=1 Tax=Escherichia coli TaxID=562 RepID=UPI00131A5D59|nr:hypothetical protein [Escherichia coli]
MSIQKKTLARLYRLDCQRGSNPDTPFYEVFAKYSPTSHAVNTVLSQKRFGGAACTQNIPCIGQRQLPASVARSHAVLALARGYSLIDRIAPDDTARLRVGV